MVTKNNFPFILISLLILLLVFGLLWFTFFAQDYEQEQILKNGLVGYAVVMDIKPTGNIYNNQPEVRLFLRVSPLTGEAYSTNLEMVISPVYLSQFQPGAKLNIKIDQHNKAKVAVDSVIRENQPPFKP